MIRVIEVPQSKIVEHVELEPLQRVCAHTNALRLRRVLQPGY
jgi:hypothetical protein